MPARSSRASEGAPSFDANSTQGKITLARATGMPGASASLSMVLILQSKMLYKIAQRGRMAPDDRHSIPHPARIARGYDSCTAHRG